MSDEHYIEVTALVGPIDPPYKLHIFDDGVMEETANGARAERIFEAIMSVDPDADVSAHVIDQDGLPDDGEDVADIVTERNRLRTDVQVQTDAADAAAEAVGAMAVKVSATLAENARLQAGIMTAEVHGELIVRMRESVWRVLEAELDRLRTVAFTAQIYLDARSLDPQSLARTDLESALAALADPTEEDT